MDMQDVIDDDEFQDAIDEPLEDAPQLADGSTKFVNDQGYIIHLPKKWTFDNSFQYENDELRKFIAEAEPGNCLITDEIRGIKPLESFISFGKSKPFRIFFYPPEEPGPWTFLEEEHAFLAEFKQHCKATGNAIPECDNEILRWAYVNKLQMQPTYDAIILKRNLLMEKFAYPISKRSVEMVERGFMYVCGRDRLFRPIVVMRYRVIQQLNPPPESEDVIGAALITILFMQKYMLENGVVENVVQIGDSQGVNVFTVPYKLIHGVIKFMTTVNRGRVRTCFELNAPQSISFVWNAIKYFFDENTQQKVSFTSYNTNPALFEMAEACQIEQCYGGTAPNRLDGQYWPPRLNSDDFGHRNYKPRGGANA